MTGQSEDDLDVSLSEALLERVLRAAWADSTLSEPYRLSAGDWSSLAGKAEATLEAPLPRPRSADGGRLRFSCRARIDLAYGVASRSRTVYEWDLLVTPQLELDLDRDLDPEEKDAPHSTRIVIDFEEAEISDLRVEADERIAGWKYDPSTLDPFSGWRRRETGRLVVRQLLRRVGERGLEIPPALVDSVSRATRCEREKMVLAVEEEVVRIGWFAIDRSGKREANTAHAPREGRTNDSANTRRRPLAVVGVGVGVVKGWLVRRIESRFPWIRVHALRMNEDPRSERLELMVRLGLAHRFWPTALHLDLVLRGVLDHSEEHIRLSVDGFDLEGLRLPGAVRARVVQGIRDQLAGVGLSRRLDHAALIRLTGPLLVESVAFDPDPSRFEVRVEEAR